MSRGILGVYFSAFRFFFVSQLAQAFKGRQGLCRTRSLRKVFFQRAGDRAYSSILLTLSISSALYSYETARSIANSNHSALALMSADPVPVDSSATVDFSFGPIHCLAGQDIRRSSCCISVTIFLYLRQSHLQFCQDVDLASSLSALISFELL